VDKTLEPSNGGMGKRLNNARLILREINPSRIMLTEVGTVARRRIRASRKARMTLLAGPARAIRAVSFLGFLRLYGSKGAGLPQPNRPVIRMVSVPKGSKWAKGLRVRRPKARGVGSPNRSAT